MEKHAYFVSSSLIFMKEMCLYLPWHAVRQRDRNFHLGDFCHWLVFGHGRTISRGTKFSRIRIRFFKGKYHGVFDLVRQHLSRTSRKGID